MARGWHLKQDFKPRWRVSWHLSQLRRRIELAGQAREAKSVRYRVEIRMMHGALSRDRQMVRSRSVVERCMRCKLPS